MQSDPGPEPCSKCSKKLLSNTISISPAKHWSLTLNNYSQKAIEVIISTGNELCERYVFQEEVGSVSNIPHLQGYFHFKKKVRPLSTAFNQFKDIHWEKIYAKKKGGGVSTRPIIEYCSKIYTCAGELWSKGIVVPPRIRIINDSQLYDWQKWMLDFKLNKEPDARKVFYFWGSYGGEGKSSFAKYLAVRKRALVLGTRHNDNKYAIVSYTKKMKKPPKIIIIDVPRCEGARSINWKSIEEIKNGMFFSGKYESEMFLMNPPHVIIFSNYPPNMNETISQDRWICNEVFPHVASLSKGHSTTQDVNTYCNSPSKVGCGPAAESEIIQIYTKPVCKSPAVSPT